LGITIFNKKKGNLGILKSETHASAVISPLEMPIALFDYIK
jgi:hypothetical protein